MSEFIQNREKRVKALLSFSKGIINGEDGLMLINRHKEALENITPYDMIEMEDRQIKAGITTVVIKQHIEKTMNVIYSYLKKYDWKKPPKGHPLFYLMLENRELEKIMDTIKKSLKENDFSNFKLQISNLSQFENHYVRKENILFPYLEKIWENYSPLKVMWSLHDDIRKKWKEIAEHIEADNDFTVRIHKDVGELFFLMFGMVFKEELVVFPIASETVSDEDWVDMQRQSAEIGYSFIEKPDVKFSIKPETAVDKLVDLFFKVETGELSKSQLEIMLNTLPLDITFVNENDEVRYFSKPEDRFFPRSPAIIGRKVQNCHPPESVHVVEKIVAAFKNGEKDSAEFWFQMKGKFIYIRYFAMRNEAGEYRGTLEVSQDITEIKKLEGTQKLLDW